MVCKVVVIGDSLSMPRAAEGLMVTDIYPVKLQLEMHDVFVLNSSERGLDSRKAISQVYIDEHIASLQPNVVVVALGIVDCTPRIFSEFEHKVLSYLSKFRVVGFFVKSLISFCSRHRFFITKNRRLSYITPNDFRKNILELLSQVKAVSPKCKFVFVNILSPSKGFVSRNYKLGELLHEYNEIINSVCLGTSGKLIDLYSFTEINDEAVFEDGYHITAIAHNYIFDELKLFVSEEVGHD
jgi:hypothetical protein